MTLWTRRQWSLGASSLIIPGFALANCDTNADDVVDLVIPGGTTDIDTWLRDAIRDGGPRSHFRLGAGVWQIGQLVLDQPNIKISGSSSSTILRTKAPTKDMIRVSAPGITIERLRLEGTCGRPTPNVFALVTDDGADTSHLDLSALHFASPAAQLGFSNAIKLNPGCDDAGVSSCTFENLWGDSAGTGYGVLCGAIRGACLNDNVGKATTSRGRHLIYLSSGASGCVASNNMADGYASEGMTIYALDYQPPCVRNTFSHNRVIACAKRGGPELGAIGVYGNCQDNEITDNLVENSGGSGIVLDGTDSAKLARATISRNHISNSAAIGIEIKAIRGARITDNTLSECSLAEPGVHPNIRIASDGKTAASDILIVNNNVSGNRYCRSSLQMNKTQPMPQTVTMRGNTFARGSLKAIELNGVKPR